MKTKIIGWIYIIFAALFFFGFAINVLLLIDGGGSNTFISIGEDSLIDLLAAFAIYWTLPLGIFLWIFGSSVKSHKKWSWYIGTPLSILVFISTLYSIIIDFSFFYLIGLIVQGWIVYAYLSEKHLFFAEKVPDNKPSFDTTPNL